MGAPRFNWDEIPLSEKFHDTRYIELGVGPVEAELLGIVERTVHGGVPPRVDYALTDKGRHLVPIVEAMREYGTRWLLTG